MSTIKAVWMTKTTRELKDVEIPKPDADQVLIRNVAVASNPKDWKYPNFVPNYSSVQGNDVAGYIESVGEEVTEYKKGDKVAGFSIMGTDPRYGAYQEYTVVPASSTFPLGPKTSFEEAATLPLAAMTAAIGLFVVLELPEKGSEDTLVVVNGASSSVGSFAVQLAKIAGYKVIGIAGSGGEYAKSLGADIVIDYRGKDGPTLTEEIKKATGGKASVAFDAISEKGSQEAVGNALGSGGVVATVLPTSEEITKRLEENGVQIKLTLVSRAYGDQKDFAARWYRQLGKWLEEGKFKGNQVKIIPKGLEGVDEGLQLLEKGKISAEKCVYIIADTPGLEKAKY